MPPKNKQNRAPASRTDLKQPDLPMQNLKWPLIEPLIPASDLSLETLVPDQIMVIRNLWTSTLCKKYISFLANLPLVTTSAVPKKGEAVRVNDRFQIDDFNFAKRLWEETALRDVVMGNGDDEPWPPLPEAERRSLWGGEVVGLNPNIRVYRYRKGQHFAQHYDDSNYVTLPTSPPTPARTTWTLLLYLTSPSTGCIGGETVFYPDSIPVKGKKARLDQNEPAGPIAVGLEIGMALLHKHGNDCMLHEGKEVLDGEKWVIRSDLCVRR